MNRRVLLFTAICVLVGVTAAIAHRRVSFTVS
jgi:hypothetical protein